MAFAAVLFVPLYPAGAENLDGQHHTIGLAMVGQPKMPPDFKHFDYANPEAPKGGTFRQATLGSFDTLNPFSLKGKSAAGLNLYYDRLMTQSWDEPFTLYPLIAQQVEIPDDRSAITFKLNPKAQFHDGSVITPEDVIFSFNTLKEKGRANMRNVYKLVKSVTILPDQRIQFLLGEGYNRETVMILAKMPVLSQKWWQGKDFDQTVLTPPLGSGPYRIKEVSAGRRIVYERDPHYWGKDLPVNTGLHNFDKISFDYFRDQTAAFEAFKSHDIDVWTDLSPGHWVTAYDFPAAKNNLIKKESLKHGRVEKMWGLIFNMRRPPFDDIRVRRALSLMVDYEWVNKNIFYGQYRSLNSFYPNSDLAVSGLPSQKEREILSPFKDSLTPEVFGPAWQPASSGNLLQVRANQVEADRLLKKSGWIIRNGIRVKEKDGTPLSFEIILGTLDDEKLALSFKRNLARLGVVVTLRTLDSTAFQDRMMNYDYDMTVYFWLNTLSPGTEQTIYWGCEAAKQSGRFNYSGLCNPAVEHIITEIPNVSSRAEMADLVHSLDRILTWEQIAIPLFYSGKDFVASWADFKHPSRTPLYGNVMESWWFSPKSAKHD